MATMDNKPGDLATDPAKATLQEKMTAIADEIRTLSGTTDKIGLDEITSNLQKANNLVDE